MAAVIATKVLKQVLLAHVLAKQILLHLLRCADSTALRNAFGNPPVKRQVILKRKLITASSGCREDFKYKYLSNLRMIPLASL